MEWISVEDRLPKICEFYLCLYIDKNVCAVNPIHEIFYFEYEFFTEDTYWRVTHWMPLPEPPKEISDEQTNNR